MRQTMGWARTTDGRHGERLGLRATGCARMTLLLAIALAGVAQNDPVLAVDLPPGPAAAGLDRLARQAGQAGQTGQTGQAGRAG